jgi:two-component system NtrC family response regulator
VAQRRFRSDLFFRLNVVHIHLPPLRERTDDIPLLVNHFLAKYSQESSLALITIEPEALRCLLDYSWPGNVRELENVIERAVILSNGEKILVKDLPQEVREPAPPSRTEDYRREPSPEKTWQPVELKPISELSHGGRLPEWNLRPRQLRTIDFIKEHGFITNKYYSQLNDLSERQALRELAEMVDSGVLQRIGKGRACRYILGAKSP